MLFTLIFRTRALRIGSECIFGLVISIGCPNIVYWRLCSWRSATVVAAVVATVVAAVVAAVVATVVAAVVATVVAGVED
ncbi:hypothetical protein HT574_14735, partial [Parageobacillus sp. VR-IP]|uniref:hypothetical protein n=1 Tax=Parageobacillus sp. VR-IP TaxID=2742205 RepID=UPI001581B03E